MWKTLNNLLGKKFGRWTVLSRAKNRYGNAVWLCRCDCGTIREVMGTYLVKGKSKSCGCLHKEICRDMQTKHGLCKEKLYYVYHGIKDRCYRTGCKSYKYYGALGIKICDEWKNDFIAFYNWAISNGYRRGLSIDRIDNDGNYSPLNCRWATPSEQRLNQGHRFGIRECSCRDSGKRV